MGASPCAPVLVLLSGGVDSSACLHFYLQSERKVRALFADYGQAARDRERAAAENVARHYNVPLQIHLSIGPSPKRTGMIPGRNAFLAFLALMECDFVEGMVALGIHSGTGYYDCSPEFVDGLQREFDRYVDGRVRIAAPFLEWDKRSVWEYARRSGIPLDLTYSCEAQNPCGACRSCLDLEALHACSL